MLLSLHDMMDRPFSYTRQMSAVRHLVQRARHLDWTSALARVALHSWHTGDSAAPSLEMCWRHRHVILLCSGDQGSSLPQP